MTDFKYVCRYCNAQLHYKKQWDGSCCLINNNGTKHRCDEEFHKRFLETMKKIDRDLRVLQAKIKEQHVEHESKENSGAKKTQKA